MRGVFTVLAAVLLACLVALPSASARGAEPGPEPRSAEPQPAGARVPASDRRTVPSAAPRDAGEVRALIHWCRETKADAEPALRRMASESADPLAAGNAICALGRLGLLRHDDPLLALLRDPRLRVRQELVVALGKCRDERVLPLLDDLARDADLGALAQHSSRELRASAAEHRSRCR